MKYEDDLVLLAKEQTLLQGLEDINMEKNYDTDNLKVTILEHTVLDQKKKKRENGECINYLASMITSEARFARKITSRIVIAKAAFPTEWTWI